jgi:glycine betaine/choline ABC-type transport system substrate-binding protein
MRNTRWISALLLLIASFALAACGDDDKKDSGSKADTSGEKAAAIESNPDNASTTITVGSKNFTEQKVLGEIYAQGLKAAGYKVKTQLNLGDEKTALKAVEKGDIDGYPEYTGTALGSFFGVKSSEIPKDPDKAFADAKDGFAKKGITAFPPTPFTSSNEVALTKAKAKELGVTKISDLSDKAGDLTLYGSPECRQREDCLKGLQDVYGLKFKAFKPVDIALRHEVLDKGQADVSIVFTTDPQIERNGYVLLEDDKGMFPPYNSTFVVRSETVQKAGPDLEATISKVQEGLTAEVMQELNARVDLDKKTPEAVAGEYLKESGLTG